MSVDLAFAIAWKSALILAAALALAALVARGAGDKALLLRLALVFAPLTPLMSLVLPRMRIETSAPVVQHVAHVAAVAGGELARAPVDAMALVALVYGAGVVVLLARLAAGLWTLQRWARAAELVTHLGWRAALAELQAQTPCLARVRLAVSRDVEAPLSFGVFRPVILIDRAALERADDARAVLAHEAAHLVRGDWVWLIGARVALALVWFNPLAWVAAAFADAHAEEAADQDAAAQMDRAAYAQTLLNCAAGCALPANSIGAQGDALARRLRLVLEDRFEPRTGIAAALLAGAAWLAIAGATAAVEFGAETRARVEIGATPVRTAARLEQRAEAMREDGAATIEPVALSADEIPAPSVSERLDRAVEASDEAAVWTSVEMNERARHHLQRAETLELHARAMRLRADWARENASPAEYRRRASRADVAEGRVATERGRVATAQGRIATAKGRATTTRSRIDQVRTMLGEDER